MINGQNIQVFCFHSGFQIISSTTCTRPHTTFEPTSVFCEIYPLSINIGSFLLYQTCVCYQHKANFYFKPIMQSVYCLRHTVKKPETVLDQSVQQLVMLALMPALMLALHPDTHGRDGSNNTIIALTWAPDGKRERGSPK